MRGRNYRKGRIIDRGRGKWEGTGKESWKENRRKYEKNTGRKRRERENEDRDCK